MPIKNEDNTDVTHQLNRLSAWGIRSGIGLHLFFMGLKISPRPFHVLKELLKLGLWYDHTFFENVGLRKIYYSQNRFFFRLHVPGWPSKAYSRLMRSELREALGVSASRPVLHFLIAGITKQCPLHCVHCSEWDRMKNNQKVDLERMKQLLKSYRDEGVCQILLSGGEPMTTCDQLSDLIGDSHRTTDYWILSSGFNLTPANAAKLKAAGIAGVTISLDHWIAGEHNAFRGDNRAFGWATRAAENVRNAGLLLCLSLCATSRFTTPENLFEYARMAKNLHAQFIQLLAPKCAGRFRLTNPGLSTRQREELSAFCREMNSNPVYRGWPAVLYAGYHESKTGCLGGGRKFLFIDTDGQVRPCPFAQSADAQACAAYRAGAAASCPADVGPAPHDVVHTPIEMNAVKPNQWST